MTAGCRRWLAALAAAAACAGAAQGARIERVSASVTLPPGRSVLSAYVEPRSGSVVLHVQPLQASGTELLVDARSGRPWAGELPQLLKDYTRLDSESLDEVAGGSARDLLLLRTLGCTRGHVLCTSALDADLLLQVRMAGGAAQLTVLDLRALLAQIEDVLAGRVPGTEADWGDEEWLALEVAAQAPERRARWVDALRSIAGIDEFQRVVASVQQAPRLAARPLFQGERAAADLRAELELKGHKLLVGAHADALLGGGGGAALGQLADALVSATQPPNQIGVATHLVDLLGSRPPEQTRRLATELAAEATRRRSDVLHCFAQWLQAQACGQGAPPWVTRDTVVAAAPAPAPTPTPRTPAQRTPRAEPAPAPAPTPAPPTAPAPPRSPEPAVVAASAPGDAPHEWTLIQRVPNKLVLVAFNEASGRMVPDRAVVGGFSFVARALGPVQDGRFEVEVANQNSAPVQLRHGQYRVRARLVLDYTREDQCVQGMSCWFARPELHAKSVPREVVFFMTVSGRFVDRRRCEFGTLLPLVADGSARYRSQLKEARLAIESVRFELL
ncbi:MAG: hypothetical protein U1F56_22390 [Rubrivivax sp.]